MPRQTGFVPDDGKLKGRLVVVTEILEGRQVKISGYQLEAKGIGDIVEYDTLKPYYSWAYDEGRHVGLNNDQLRKVQGRVKK